MRIIRYELGGQSGLGVMVDERRFVSLRTAAPELPSTLLGLLNLESGLDPVRRAVDGRKPELSIEDVTLKPFLEQPNALWALALNFKSHIAETGLTTSREYPHLFLRTAVSYVGHGEPLLCPQLRSRVPSTMRENWASSSGAPAGIFRSIERWIMLPAIPV